MIVHNLAHVILHVLPKELDELSFALIGRSLQQLIAILGKKNLQFSTIDLGISHEMGLGPRLQLYSLDYRMFPIDTKRTAGDSVSH